MPRLLSPTRPLAPLFAVGVLAISGCELPAEILPNDFDCRATERTVSRDFDEADRMTERITEHDGTRRIETFAYDAAGALVRQTDDSDGDGAPEFTVDFQRSEGRLDGVVVHEAQGTWTVALTYTDAQLSQAELSGPVSFRLIDGHLSSFLDSLGWRATLSPVAEVDLMLPMSVALELIGSAGQSDAPLVAEYRYDPAGALSEVVWSQSSAEGEATPIGHITVQHLPGERVLRVDDGPSEDDALSSPSVVHRTLLDEAGEVIGETFDMGGDGSVERSRRFERAPGMVVESRDEDGDGLDDERLITAFTADGQVELLEKDFEADGVVDWRKTYTYDDAGRAIMAERDRDLDGMIDRRWTWSYDAAGNPTEASSVELTPLGCRPAGGLTN